MISSVQEYCEKLEKGQALYNSLVEPFNEIETSRRQNDRKLFEVTNRLKKNEKLFDEMREEQRLQSKLNV